MSERNQRHVQQMYQQAEFCPNLRPTESREIINHYCFKQLKIFSVARYNETSCGILHQQTKAKQFYGRANVSKC